MIELSEIRGWKDANSLYKVFIGFGFATNVLVTAMLLTGGSAVASSLTGVPTAAACFLLPIGVVIYSMFFPENDYTHSGR